MKGAAAKRAEIIAFEIVQGAAGKPVGEYDFSLRPEEQPVLDRLVEECGLRRDGPEYFLLRGILALVVGSTRTLCELSIAETIGGDHPGAIAAQWVQNIEVHTKDDFGLDEDYRKQIAAVVFRYVDETISAAYSQKMAQADEAIFFLASTLNIAVDRREDFRHAILSFVARANTTTKAVLKWERDRLPDETPASFADRAGYEHRGEIHDQDRALSVKLSNWLRTHKWPEDVPYIPTKPEWNDRQIEKLPQLRDEPATREFLRVDAVARKRRKAFAHG
jgi:hypothetical protein